MVATSSVQDANPSTFPLQDIQELSITIAAKELDPTLLSEQFLKFSGIVPNEWELARQPVLNPGGSQVMFKNGVGIVAQPRTIMFMETIGAKELKEVLVADVARQYVSKLPNAEYKGITISPKYLAPFPSNIDGARQYITKTLLSPGPWQDVGNAPIQAGVNFLYQLDRCQLNLNINQAMLQLPDQQSIAAVLFAGNFNYPIETTNPQECLALILKGLDEWQSDFAIFKEIINERFLSHQQPESVFTKTR